MAGPGSDAPGLARSELVRVLESAARLQEIVPDAVLVVGSAAALWANHRSSFDHDHVLADLSTRFDAVLEAIEATDGWVTNRVTPGKIILGDLGDIESGIRQLIRNRPLEVTEVSLPSGHVLRVPTPDETLRIKGYLIVRRNQVRDYLDVAALADRYGLTPRELEVLRLLPRGLTNQEIGDALYIEKRTAQTHVQNIFIKWGVNTRAEAVALAVERGLV